MEEVLEPLAVLVPVFGSIILFVKILTDYYLRKRMVDKGLVNENAIELLKKHDTQTGKYGSLKWGLLVLFGGIGLIVINYLDYRHDSPLPFGMFAVFLSLGFLIYYFYVKRETDSQQ